jgi:hypothetical protein
MVMDHGYGGAKSGPKGVLAWKYTNALRASRRDTKENLVNLSDSL